jgi:putative transposase
MFRVWLEYFGKVFGRITIAVPAHGMSKECSSCGTIVKKSLSTRTHSCQCGCLLDRDRNAAKNILQEGIEYGGAHRNLDLRSERLSRIDRYRC